MKTRSRIWHFLLAIVLMIAGATGAWARILPHYPIDYLVLKSDLIVQGRVEKGSVVVEKVILGKSSPGASVEFATYIDLPSRVCDSPFMTALADQSCRDLNGNTAVVFLQHNKPDSWEVTGEGSGLKWFDGERVLGYYQIENPGPYGLSREREANTPQDLDQAIRAALEKRDHYFAALNNPDPQKRIQGLRPFLADSGNGLFWREALNALAATGPLAGKTLRELAEEPSGMRFMIVAAMGDAGDPDCVPLLNHLVENGQSFLREVRFTTAPPDPRRVLNEWQSALCALAKINSPKAHALLLESMSDWPLDEQAYGVTAGVCIEQGLNKYPRAEDLAYFQKVYSLYPRWYAWKGSGPWASWRAMGFLEEHKFKEAIPLLVQQLDHPEAATSDEAMRLLRELVGSDLGKSKEPWMNWYTGNQKRN